MRLCKGDEVSMITPQALVEAGLYPGETGGPLHGGSAYRNSYRRTHSRRRPGKDGR